MLSFPSNIIISAAELIVDITAAELIVDITTAADLIVDITTAAELTVDITTAAELIADITTATELIVDSTTAAELLILKKIGSARLRESDIHPISRKTIAPQYQPIDRKKRKGKIVEDYSRDRAA